MKRRGSILEILNSIWLFIQDQILGMKWLNGLIGDLLSTLGLDIHSQLGGSIQFFIYDVIKITILLCVLIFMISYIQSYFPPAEVKNNRTFSWYKSKYYFGITWNSDPFLFMFFNSIIYWIYKFRFTIRGDIFISHFFANGRFRKSCLTDEYLWQKLQSPMSF